LSELQNKTTSKSLIFSANLIAEIAAAVDFHVIDCVSNEKNDNNEIARNSENLLITDTDYANNRNNDALYDYDAQEQQNDLDFESSNQINMICKGAAIISFQ
jgi:DNA modification methylase